MSEDMRTSEHQLAAKAAWWRRTWCLLWHKKIHNPYRGHYNCHVCQLSWPVQWGRDAS